jgi:DNA-3-methyladenine glycosylase II
MIESIKVFFKDGALMSEMITLTKESASVKYLAAKDPKLKQSFDLIGDLSYSLYDDPYSFLVETIASQMLSGKVADVICGRINQACNGSLKPETIDRFTVEDLRSFGLSNAKSRSIFELTSTVITGELDLTALYDMPDDGVMKSITSIRGLGNWSAKMFLIFVLGREDVLPFEDAAFLQAYSWLYKTERLKKADVEKRCEKWQPYRSIAARYLYRLLDAGFTK